MADRSQTSIGYAYEVLTMPTTVLLENKKNSSVMFLLPNPSPKDSRLPAQLVVRPSDKFKFVQWDAE